ncbi:MAG TPA: diacylglycerol kinase family lipid kinase, partial [Roseiflexaceae bacterium]|nr:diacylglycerol kinase family lipid kinase [Roseiflexaceae bacterium]
MTTANSAEPIAGDVLPRTTRAMIVFNPVAGQAETLAHDIQIASEIWQEHGWHVNIRPTAAPGDGSRIAREAAALGYDLVVAAGGDGTINEVVNGLAGTQTALAPLPAGTVNVWAREIGLPLNPRATAEALLHARIRRIDLGRAGDRYFLLMAGVGFDAAVVNQVRSSETRRFGIFAYLIRISETARRFRGVRAQITIDGRRVRRRVLLVVLGNSQLYGGVMKMTARATIDDGLLDVCIIKGTSLLSAPRIVLAILLQRHTVDPSIEYYRARTVSVDARTTMPVQVDGDHIGTTPMSFEAVPGALSVLMPSELESDLLRIERPGRRPAWPRAIGWISRGLARLIPAA